MTCIPNPLPFSHLARVFKPSQRPPTLSLSSDEVTPTDESLTILRIWTWKLRVELKKEVPKEPPRVSLV
jgi:hypothetical protein